MDIGNRHRSNKPSILNRYEHAKLQQAWKQAAKAERTMKQYLLAAVMMLAFAYIIGVVL